MNTLKQIYQLVIESSKENLKMPYISFLKELTNIKTKDGKNIKIYTVDGDYIRTNIDEEWTNFGQHYRFDCVPKDEFWISKETPKDEYEYYIKHLIKEYSLMAHGELYDIAITGADKVEHKMRERTDDLKKVIDPKTGRIDYSKFHKELIKTLDNGIKVWRVNGKLVRDVLDIEWVEGGHNYVYFFVPKNEVWIDDKIDTVDMPYVLLHELHERNLMKKGMSYLKAHADSSKIELYARKHIEELESLLQNEGY